MRIVIEKNNKNILHAAFAIWLISEIIFAHTPIAQVALLLFTGFAILVVPMIQWPYMLTGYGLMILWSVMNISTGHAVSQSLALDMTRTAAFCLIFLYGFFCYYRYIGNIREILTIYVWVVTVFSCMCLVGGISSVLAGERLSTFGVNANIIATQAGYALIFIVSELLRENQKKNKTLCGIQIALFVLTILMTGSRKGLIIPVLGVYLLVAFRRSRRFWIHTLVAVVAGCIVLWMMLNIPVLYRLVGYRIKPVLLYFQQADFDEGSLQTRLSFIHLAWTESKDAPLWGHGLDCFRKLRYSYGTYSHCNYMEILYSLGWPGLFFYYVPYLCVFFRIPKLLRHNRELAVLLLAFLVPYLVCDYFNVTYFSRVMLSIPAMVMFSLSEEKNNENKESV